MCLNAVVLEIADTKALWYQCFGSGHRGKITSQVTDISTSYGFKKICCSRDHIFALDFAGILHVFR